MIYLDHRVRAGAFNQRSEKLMEHLAGQAALAIRQVRRLEEIRRKVLLAHLPGLMAAQEMLERCPCAGRRSPALHGKHRRNVCEK